VVQVVSRRASDGGEPGVIPAKFIFILCWTNGFEKCLCHTIFVSLVPVILSFPQYRVLSLLALGNDNRAKSENHRIKEWPFEYVSTGT